MCTARLRRELSAVSFQEAEQKSRNAGGTACATPSKSWPFSGGAGGSACLARLRAILAHVLSDQLPICDKFAGWASWMSFSEPEVPEVQRLSAEKVSKN